MISPIIITQRAAVIIGSCLFPLNAPIVTFLRTAERHLAIRNCDLHRVDRCHDGCSDIIFGQDSSSGNPHDGKTGYGDPVPTVSWHAADVILHRLCAVADSTISASYVGLQDEYISHTWNCPINWWDYFDRNWRGCVPVYC
jgi:hypothetical protein